MKEKTCTSCALRIQNIVRLIASGATISFLPFDTGIPVRFSSTSDAHGPTEDAGEDTREVRPPSPSPHPTLEQLRSQVLTQVRAAVSKSGERTATTAVQPSQDPPASIDTKTTTQPLDRPEPVPRPTTVPSRSDDEPSTSTEDSHPSPWAEDILIAQRYRLLANIAAGAWGTIWQARQEGIERLVAIKVLKEREGQSMRNARARFEREARLASRIRHPSAVRILDFGHHDAQAYLVMEWLDGMTLSEFVRDCGPLPPDLILDIGVGICGALHAAHQEGVIHRDLKPSNIMLVETSRGLTPVVVDFGLARTFTADESTVTRADMVVGTPSYMCPESIRGLPLSHTSDIYSLGVTFLTAIIGENPFRGETGGVSMTNHLMERPIDTNLLIAFGCSPALADLLLSMVAIEPTDRPTARALEGHFQSLLDAQIARQLDLDTAAPDEPGGIAAPVPAPSLATPTPFEPQTSRTTTDITTLAPRKKRRGLIALFVLLVLVATALAAGVFRPNGRATSTDPPPPLAASQMPTEPRSSSAYTVARMAAAGCTQHLRITAMNRATAIAALSAPSPTDTTASPPDPKRAKATKTSTAADTRSHSPAARIQNARLIITIAPPGRLHINDEDYGMRSNLLLRDLPAGTYRIAVQRGEQTVRRIIRLRANDRHVETF